MTAAQSMKTFWAFMLSPNIGICESLLRGELVDQAALDPQWYETALHLRVIGIRDALDHLFVIAPEEDRRAAA